MVYNTWMQMSLWLWTGSQTEREGLAPWMKKKLTTSLLVQLCGNNSSGSLTSSGVKLRNLPPDSPRTPTLNARRSLERGFPTQMIWQQSRRNHNCCGRCQWLIAGDEAWRTLENRGLAAYTWIKSTLTWKRAYLHLHFRLCLSCSG